MISPIKRRTHRVPASEVHLPGGSSIFGWSWQRLRFPGRCNCPRWGLQTKHRSVGGKGGGPGGGHVAGEKLRPWRVARMSSPIAHGSHEVM